MHHKGTGRAWLEQGPRGSSHLSAPDATALGHSTARWPEPQLLAATWCNLPLSRRLRTSHSLPLPSSSATSTACRQVWPSARVHITHTHFKPLHQPCRCLRQSKILNVHQCLLACVQGRSQGLPTSPNQAPPLVEPSRSSDSRCVRARPKDTPCDDPCGLGA